MGDDNIAFYVSTSPEMGREQKKSPMRGSLRRSKKCKGQEMKGYSAWGRSL
jgi:hypothetical protein